MEVLPPGAGHGKVEAATVKCGSSSVEGHWLSNWSSAVRLVAIGVKMKLQWHLCVRPLSVRV